MVRSAPVVATLFLLPALGLAGIPPLSGFVPKVALVDAGPVSDQPAVVALRLHVSLLTHYSLVQIWSDVFWKPAADAPDASPHEVGRCGRPPVRILPTLPPGVHILALARLAAPPPDHSN